MALRTVKHSDPPCVARVIAANTAADLHDADAPEGCKHLPAGVIFHTAGTFEWTDATGTNVSTIIAASGLGIFCPIAPAAIRAATTPAVTVFWRK